MRSWGRGGLGALAGGEATASLLILAMMCLMVADVAGRELLGAPLTGATELIEICLVGAVFAGLPALCWHEGHITADLFDHVLGRWAIAVSRAVGCLIGAVVLGLAAWQIARIAGRAIRFGDETAQLGLPLAWVLAGMSALVAAAALASLLRAGWIMLHPATRQGPSLDA